MFMIEKKTPVGPVLEHEKWVRYTYDFGNDWKHKVIFEKKMPEYTADHLHSGHQCKCTFEEIQ